MNKFKCYKTPKDNELCLCEDIFQQHQAKLIDCDSEDAKAVSSYANENEEKRSNDLESTSSMSECCCNTSTQSSESTEQKEVAIVEREDPPAVIESNEQKLTLEEREKALKDLDEIINSIKITRNIREFGSLDLSTTDRKNDFKKSRFLSSMLELNFSEMAINDHVSDDSVCVKELNNNVSSTNQNNNEDPTEDSEFTMGKVARLTKFFSEMGEAGIIRTYKGNRAMGRQFKSEPNISFNNNDKCDERTKNASMTDLTYNVPCRSDTPGGATETYKTEHCNVERQFRSKSLNIDRVEIDDCSSSSSSSTNRILFARSKTLNVDELDKISHSDSVDSRKLSDLSVDLDSLRTVIPSNHFREPLRESSSSSDSSVMDRASYSEKQDRFKHIKDSFFNNTISDEAGTSEEKFIHIHNFLMKEELLKQRMKSGSIDMYHMEDAYHKDEMTAEQRRRKMIPQKTMGCQSNFSFIKDPSIDTDTSVPQREKLKRWYSDQIFEEPSEDISSKDIFRRVLRNNLNKTKFRAKRMRNVIVTPIKIHQRIILRQDQEGIAEEDGVEPSRKL